jgi:hypothetical protein
MGGAFPANKHSGVATAKTIASKTANGRRIDTETARVGGVIDGRPKEISFGITSKDSTMEARNPFLIAGTSNRGSACWWKRIRRLIQSVYAFSVRSE